MSPPILRRVAAPGSKLSTARPAILANHRRHRVRDADYPAIIPVPNEQGSTVRGTFVSGLSKEDVRRLDVFEGDEYVRVGVWVRLLPTASASSDAIPGSMSSSNEAAGAPLPIPATTNGAPTEPNGQANAEPASHSPQAKPTQNTEKIEAQTYIWSAPHSRLEDGEWDFDEFVREKMWRWAPGGEGEQRGEYEGLDGTGGRSVEGGGFERSVLGATGTGTRVDEVEGVGGGA